MRVKLSAVVSLGAILLAGSAPATAQSSGRFTLTSTDLKPNGMIQAHNVANTFGCSGQNVSPALQWSGAPAGTKSFAITAYDPDAPTGSGLWHWVVYNIPATVTTLPAGAGAQAGGALPAGAVQGHNDVWQESYLGPCPPVGDKAHRYIFTVYALKTAKLDVPANATAALVGFNLHGNLLGKATLTARYRR